MQMLFAILKPIIFIVAKSPFWLIYLYSNVAYFIFYKLLRYRVKVVRKNLGMVFPTYMIPELKKIEKDYYKQLFDLLFEGIKYSKISKEKLQKRCRVENPEIFDHFFDNGQNVLVVMGHSGNWEWASGAVNQTIKHQLQSLYQPIKNQTINDFVLDIRERFGTKLIERKTALRTLLEQKDMEEKFASVFIADQSPYEMNKASFTSFFGIETPFFNGYASLAQKLDLPIIFSHVKKIKRGYYSIENQILTENAGKLTQEQIVSAFAKKLEFQINRQQFNWLWTHKRWKRARF